MLYLERAELVLQKLLGHLALFEVLLLHLQVLEEMVGLTVQRHPTVGKQCNKSVTTV
jgi:hypothetical protein